jgi:hypothetical protein
MKKVNFLGIIGVAIIIAFGSLMASCMEETTEVVSQELIVIENTSLCVLNNTNDSVTAYLTLGSIGDTNYVQSTVGIFGILTSGTQNSFVIAPHDTLCYMSPNGKGFNGNISFGVPPQNCPDTTQLPNGINLFEFALNNAFNVNGQETIDISCVSGVNSYIMVSMFNGGAWNNGADTVKVFRNGDLYENTGLTGVFPFGCDSCVGITPRTPYCAGHKPYATPQKTNMCNIQRNSTANGGAILVQFNGFVK